MALLVELPVSVIVVPLPWVKFLPMFRVVAEDASLDELKLKVPPVMEKSPAIFMVRVAAAVLVVHPVPYTFPPDCI